LFKGKKILITGGTGSLGRALTERLLKLDVDTIRIFSRNENKQVTMESEIPDDRLRFFIGDVRDYNRLTKALEDIDIVFHAAALKHVPVVEYNPFEAIKTNIIGSQNLINACLNEDVEIAVGVGTDKAVSPLNTYGATKLLMEKLFVTAQNYTNTERHRTKFISLRYGNVLGSSGSVVPKFINQIKSKQKITITHPDMTRFSITMEEALDFILNSTINGKGSEIFVPKLKAYSILDVRDALKELLGDFEEEVTSIRPGEKMHEVLINEDEIRSTWEEDSKYAILNTSFVNKDKIKSQYPKMKQVELFSQYSSDLAEKIRKSELKELIKNSGLLNEKE
jgi:UDP-N-acetylglucosamine 4,6-dehydratase/5-epimerase